MTMDLNEFQRLAETTALYPASGTGDDRAINYCLVGMVNEAGEAMGKWKKHLRGDDGETLTAERRKALLDELGDVLWYVANAAGELNADLHDVAINNVDKLASRAARGMITGDGDKR